MRRGIAVAAALVVVVAACGQAPAPDGSEPTGQPIFVEGRNAGFALSMRIGSDVVDAGAPIDIVASLMWEGPAAAAAIWGSGSGLVSFGLEQIDGDIAIAGAINDDCTSHEYRRLVPVAIGYSKSGGFSADDPNADFYRTFFADPVLRLPAGRWKVTAGASGFLVPCEFGAPMVNIGLEATIQVR